MPEQQCPLTVARVTGRRSPPPPRLQGKAGAEGGQRSRGLGRGPDQEPVAAGGSAGARPPAPASRGASSGREARGARGAGRAAAGPGPPELGLPASRSERGLQTPSVWRSLGFPSSPRLHAARAAGPRQGRVGRSLAPPPSAPRVGPQRLRNRGAAPPRQEEREGFPEEVALALQGVLRALVI